VSRHKAPVDRLGAAHRRAAALAVLGFGDSKDEEERFEMRKN
jgi:hypothetical protein